MAKCAFGVSINEACLLCPAELPRRLMIASRLPALGYATTTIKYIEESKLQISPYSHLKTL